MELVTLTENGMLTQQTLELIADIERRAKEVKAQQEAVKTALLKVMEESGTIKFESDKVNITYVAETVRESFDTAGFRKENPDQYDKYVRFSNVKPSIRIKVKD